MRPLHLVPVLRIAALAAAMLMLAAVTAGAAGAPIKGVTHKLASVSELDGVACPAANSCLAVGEKAINVSENSYEGVVVPVSRGKPGTPAAVAETDLLSAVACPSASLCIAVGGYGSYGQDGAIVLIKHGKAGAPIEVPGYYLGGIGCGSSTVCWATGLPVSGTGGGVLIRVTNLGTTQIHKLSFDPYCGEGCSVSPVCRSATACLLGGTSNLASVNGSGVVAAASDGRITAVHKVPALSSVAGLFCSTETACAGVGFKSGTSSSTVGAMQISNGKPGRVHVLAHLEYARPLVCSSKASCLAFGYGFSSGKANNEAVELHDAVPGKAVKIAVTVRAAACFKGKCVAAGSSQTGSGQHSSSVGDLFDFDY